MIVFLDSDFCNWLIWNIVYFAMFRINFRTATTYPNQQER